MRIFLSACEASADRHAYRVLQALRQQTSASIPVGVWGTGGPYLRSLPEFHMVFPAERLGHLGFVEVLRDLPVFVRLRRWYLHLWQAYRFQCIVLMDFPGFHLRVLRDVVRRRIHLPVIYYILPQLWAWYPERALILRHAVRLLAILPFEPQFYRRMGIRHVVYVGNPVVEAVREHRVQPVAGIHPSEKPIVALVPGSRSREIDAIFPVMLQAAGPLLRSFRFVVAPPMEQRVRVHWWLKRFRLDGRIPVFAGRLYDVLAVSQAAIVTSGTATLETALWCVPQVVLYRGNWLSYAIARLVARVRAISLVNLIANRIVVPELLQERCTPERVRQELLRLFEERVRRAILTGYAEVTDRLGTQSASQTVARHILEVSMQNRGNHN